MRRLAIALAAAAAILPHAAQAQQGYAPAPGAVATPFTPAFPPGLEFDVAGGYLNAASREYVFVPETKAKLSELRWRDPAAYGVDAALAYRITPWLTFRARGFVPIGSKDSKMKDFDWIPPYNLNGAFSDFSQHPKTELTSGYKIDLSVQGDFVQTDSYSLGVVGDSRSSSGAGRRRAGATSTRRTVSATPSARSRTRSASSTARATTPPTPDSPDRSSSATSS